VAKTLLITGATGLVGRLILPLLAQQQPQRKILAISRQTASLPGVEMHSGDLKLPKFGWSDADYSTLAGQVTEVLHLAADLRFTIPFVESASSNVVGTENVLRFASDCPNLQKFAHISTTYVLGKGEGDLPENRIDHQHGYWNVYQKTKHQAEALAYDAAARLPIAVFRLSSQIGSTSGVVTQFNYFHQLLRLLPVNPFRLLAADADALVDLVPDDWSAQALAHLFDQQFHPGETFQLAAGPDRSWTVAELLREAAQVMKVPSSRWPQLTRPSQIEEASAGKWKFFLAARPELFQALEYFTPQMTVRQRFLTDKTQALLDQVGLHCPHISDYYGKVLHWCVQTHWGKRPISAPADTNGSMFGEKPLARTSSAN
jgi:thioester reductase-like protein